MMNEFRKRYEDGMESLRWIGSMLSERIRIEVNLFRILGDINNLERSRGKLMRDIGECVFAMRTEPITDIYSIKEIRDLIRQIEELDSDITAKRKEAAEISSLETE